MSGKSAPSYRQHLRRKKRKRKRQQHHEEREEDPSQDLLSDGNERDEQHEYVPDSRRQQHDGSPPEEPQGGLDEPMDVVMPDESSVDARRNKAAKVQDDHPDDASLSSAAAAAATQKERSYEDLKKLLSRALLDLSASQDQCEQVQKALLATQEALAFSQAQCDVYHKKYSDLKSKFYKWYHYFLKQWAAKFRNDETQDAPPRIDISPLSSHRQPAAASVAVEPRRILQDNLVTPSPWAQRPASSINNSIQPKRLSGSLRDKENVNNESNMDSVANIMSSVDSSKKYGDDVTAGQSERQHKAPLTNAQTRQAADSGDSDVILNVATKDDNVSVHQSGENETQLNILFKGKVTEHSRKGETQFNAPVKNDMSGSSRESDTQYNAPVKDDASVQSGGSETQLIPLLPSKEDDAVGDVQESDTQYILPPEDEGSVLSEESDSQCECASPRKHSRATPNVGAIGSGQKIGHVKNTCIESSPNYEDDETQMEWDSYSIHEKKGAQEKEVSSTSDEKVIQTRLSVQTAGPSSKECNSTPQAFAHVNEDASQTFLHEHEDTSQALFSQIPEMPHLFPLHQASPKPAACTADSSKERKNAKNTSVVKATQGWTSNVAARAFVRDTTNPPVKNKPRTGSEVKPDAVLSEPAASAAAPVSKSARSSMEPPNNPYAHKKSPNDAIASSRLSWSDEEDSPVPYKYQDVVRCQRHRRQLPAHECFDCKRFVDVVCGADGGHVYDRKKLVDCSRHRSRASPPSTPDDFWELSFADERQARENNSP